MNKVTGNFHVAPGRSFAINGMHVHDTVSSILFGIDIRRNISIKRMAPENTIQVISYTICASVLISTNPSSKAPMNGVILSEGLKSIPTTVLSLPISANYSKLPLPLLPKVRFDNLQIPLILPRTNKHPPILHNLPLTPPFRRPRPRPCLSSALTGRCPRCLFRLRHLTNESYQTGRTGKHIRRFSSGGRRRCRWRIGHCRMD